MIREKRPIPLTVCLLAGLGLILAACTLPVAGGAPQASPTPTEEAPAGGAAPDPSPTPSTGHVQPVISF